VRGLKNATILGINYVVVNMKFSLSQPWWTLTS